MPVGEPTRRPRRQATLVRAASSLSLSVSSLSLSAGSLSLSAGSLSLSASSLNRTSTGQPYSNIRRYVLLAHAESASQRL